jgi:drug/metabolite transporter (DMT)-like permease
MSTPVHTPVTNPTRPREAATRRAAASTRATSASLPDDGTRPLLQGAFWTLLIGILAALATLFVFGGVGIHGPHTNGGWLSLIVAMMCLPFGCMLLLLGGAKYLRNRRLTRKNR